MTTATIGRDASAPLATVRALTWHRPLIVLAAAMAVLALLSLVGVLVDERELLGAPIWAKPFKFAVSIMIYALTLSWLTGLFSRWRRVAWWTGTLAAAALLVEIVIIVGAVVGGTTSHFNVATPFNTALWSIMGLSIIVVWVATLAVGILLFRTDLGDHARTIAIRSGVVIGLIGMGVAFFMTSPTAEQLNDFQGVAGAHAVGIADGGPGLPLLGWSTVAGDLRVPHFVGMHALQLLPLAAVLLELLARRVRPLRASGTRFGVMSILSALFLGVVVLLTVQALMGQSVVRPDAAAVTATILLFGTAASAIALVLAHKSTRGNRMES